MAAAPPITAPQIPEANIGPVQERELPAAPPLRRIVGPSVILVGVGIASGEYILFPYIASQVGLVFLWAGIVGLLTQYFINMEIERYTLATGDCVTFDADLAHQFENPGKEEAVLLAVVSAGLRRS